jgi:tetratricopeptide (TPR) repeat protein
LNPNYAQAFNNRGIAYGKKADHDRAIRDYDRAIALFPEYADAYYNRGTAYNDKRYYDHAILDFDRAVKLNPNFARALYARGTAKLKRGTRSAATRILLPRMPSRRISPVARSGIND